VSHSAPPRPAAPSVEEKRRLLVQKLRTAAGRGDTFPLSFAQQRLWVVHQADPAAAAYNISHALRLDGALDAELLARALTALAHRHESLRTVFPAQDGVPVQRVLPPGPVVPEVVDLRGLPAEAREAQAARLAREEAARPFDLAHGPLLRVRLLRTGAAEDVVLFTMHHIVSDAWSQEILVRDLSELYTAAAEGRDPVLPPLPVQYADFAAWQREWLQGPALDEHLAYWRDRLAGAPPLLDLPADHPRTAAPGEAADHRSFALSADVSARLHARAREAGATPFMLLLAAFQAVLARWSGETDVVVGVPVAGRTRLQVENLAGFFVNLLALRTDLSGDPPFRELLARVRETVLGAHAHQDLPFDTLVDALKLERSTAVTPLFQVLFTFRPPAGPPLRLGPVRVAHAAPAGESAKYDLSLETADDGGRMGGSLTFRRSLFGADTVQRMLDHLSRVLEQAADDPGVRLSALRLMGDGELRAVTEGWNRTDADLATEQCIHHLFQDQVERTPDAVAVAFEGGTLSYRALDRRANRLAHRLARLGVGPDVRVGICVERSLELAVAVLAALKADGAYVPLDPEYPEERLRWMLADSAPAVLLVQERLAGRFGDAGIPLVAVDGDESSWAALPDTPPRPGGLRPGHLAYVIYTSGSTGRPKGVMNAHRGVVNRLLWMQDAYGLAADDAVLQKTTVSFDVSVWELFWPLATGARLVMARPEGHRDPGYLAEAIRREGITTLHFVPSMLQLFLEHPRAGACRGLRRVVCSGEALPPVLVERFHALLPGVELHNLYGPTEAAVDVTAWPCVPGDGGRARVPLGRPIANTRTYVLDARLAPAPIGVPGELYLGGVQVARGYLGRPALTAERFVPDPLGPVPGARLYRTGDRARWRADGTLDYLGRLDGQVKIRGLRVETGEVEAALRRHPGVSACAVVAREDAPGDRRLVAYVAGGADAGELRAHLRQGLPEYMVPGAFVALDALPLTPNGKLDVRALPAPGPGGAEDGYVAPRTPLEETLAALWAGVLRVERVGVHDSFFDAGGHSLLAVRMLFLVQQAFRVELPLRAVLDHPTVAALAEVVRDAAGLAAAAPPIPAAGLPGRGDTFPLSFAQQRLWVVHQVDPGSAAYHMPYALRVSGGLDADVLAKALTALAQRHEALRTVFPAEGGIPVQRVLPPAPVVPEVTELRHLPAEAREAEAARLARDEAAAPFDLARGPLLRVRLLRMGEAEDLLLFTMHHIVSDGWSQEILVRDLSELYTAAVEGRDPVLPPLPVQYADFAAWQREWLRGAVLEEHLAYWRARLAGAPPLLDLPTDRPRTARPGDAAGRRSAALSPELSAALRARGREEGATPFMLLLGAFQAVLARWSGEADVVVGAPAAGRTRPQVENLAGFFVNLLALRTDLSGDPSFRELLARVRETVLGAHAHQELPFDMLVDALKLERSPAVTPLFQVLFTFHPSAREPLRLGDARVAAAAASRETAKFDLALDVMDDGERLSVSLLYRRALFAEDTAGRMLDHLARVLEQAAADPGVRLSALRLLAPAERARVVEEWNRAAAEPPPARAVHRHVEAWAARAPGAVALVHEGERWTYARVNGCANTLARALRAGGAGCGAFVPVLAERGPAAAVAMLAVMKSGAAFVPLDPAWPQERLRRALRELRAPLVVACAASLPAAGALGAPVLAADLDAGEAPDLEVEPGAEDPLYAIYTSGSTGIPKAAVVPHGGIANRFAWMSRRFGAPSAACVLQTTAHVYDSAVWQLLWPLTEGGRTVVPRAGGEADARYLVELVRAEGVTMTDFVPSVFNAIVPELVSGRVAREALASLRTVVVGGEQITAETTHRFMDAFPDVRVVNLYGPTECSIGSVCHPVGMEDGGRIPIGRPIDHTTALLLDRRGDPVPVGVPGEIHLGGRCVGLGYLNAAARTAAAFVPDPYAARPGARLYRTGDLGRYRADGSIEYLRRLDDQVKIRGFRIEPAEVERALASHPRVRQARVVVRGDGTGEKRLVAYVVGDAPGQEMRAHLRRTLPEYMVPAAFVALDALPLTPGGKLDRAALPAPEPAAAAGPRTAPRTAVGEVLAEIWAEVLGVPRVDDEDGFFELGGHSLLAVRMTSRVREVFGVELPLRAVFEHPTLAALAEAVRDAAGRAAGAPPLVPVERAAGLLARLDRMPEDEVDRRLGQPPADGGTEGAGAPAPAPLPLAERRSLLEARLRQAAARGEDFPLSFAQQRLWVVHQVDPGSAAYNIPYALRLSSGLDVDLLGRALTALVRRHEALRTVFPAGDGVPVQRVLPPSAVLPEVADLRHLPGDTREAEAVRLAREEAATPFDLARGPLLRVRVLRMGDADDVVLFTLHHIVSDGWSQEILVRELSEAYTAAVEGRDAVLPPLAVQYADYAAWQRKWLRGAALEEHLGFWRRRLEGAPPVLELPVDRPRGTLDDGGAHCSLALAPEVARPLRALSRGQGATLFMTLLAAFQGLLSRLSGETDVVVGTPVAGRTRAEVDDVIGFFVNLLALRTRLGGDPSFLELLARVREGVLEAHDHQDLPFDRLVDALQPERSPAVTPFFQVLFSLHHAAGPLRLGAARARRLEGGDRPVKYDLDLEVTDDGERLEATLLYRPALFDAGTAARVLAQLARVLAQVAADPELRLSRLQLLDAAERRRVVEEWNRTDADYPAHLCIHHLFEAQARRTPDAAAVVFGDVALTFGELDARANRLARHLVRRGIGPEARVGICLERGLELMVCILGVLKAGGAYVPVDPGHPAERTGYVLRDGAVRMVLTQERLRGRLPLSAEVPVLAVDAAWARIAAEDAAADAGAPETGVTSENLCYVIYTSGSTGRPKGVAMHHRGVVNYLDWGVRFYGADGGSGAPVFSSMAVDLTITNLLPLFAGRPVHMLPEENAVEALADTLRRRPGFGLIKITPTHLSLLTPLITPEEARAAAGTLVIGADALAAEPTRWWQENAPEVRLMNEYGPTETVVGCSAYLLPNGVHRAGPVPVGGAIQNLRFYVLDGWMHPVPAGVAGELYIGGAGVARGYLGRPALSAEKFVPDPFAETGARMYRTGDRARWLEGGNLMVLGRTDNQVKVRGYRVEPGEIQAVLRRHPDVSACLVVLREDRPGDRRLVAYVVGGAQAEALREHLRASLPEYMVPAAFVRLESLPNTSTGKVDPRTLPAPDYGSAAERYVAPRTPVEGALAEVWAQVLGVERVGVQDSFYALGGDSILAIQAASRARWAGVHVTPRQMLEHHTVAALAAVAEVEPSPGAGAADEEVPAGAVPLTPIQAAFFSREHPVPAHHNLTVLMEVDAAVPHEALDAAFDAVVRHHDALRLRYRRTAAGWEQKYAAEAGIALERVDLSRLAPGERDRAQGDEAGRRQAALDLEHGPLGSAVLFDRGEEGRILFFTLHHLVVDGVSWRILREDLDRACAQALAGERVDLGPRSTSFQRWARALEAYAGSGALRAQADYWLAQGPQGTPPLPADGDGEQTLGRMRMVTVQLSGEETRALLHDVPARYGTQINDVLLCALAQAMEGWTGSPRNRVALEGHGRAEEVAPGLELTRSLGWFTAIYPVVLDITGASGAEERLRRVREQLLAVPVHGVGYGVLRWLSPDAEVRRALAAQPEPGIIFNYLGQFDQGLAPGMRVRFGSGPRGIGVAPENLRPHAVSVAGSIVGGQLSLHWTYGKGTHRRETVERLAGGYLDALRALISGAAG
jgi:amino acid adenylation domain-containing protein/non-ribosomal peptide synthase protein (TIGR01720 family)